MTLAKPSTAQPPTAPTQTTRTIVSLLLIFHLFALTVVVLWRFTTASLETRLREVPGVLLYTQVLGLDASYAFNLTRNMFRQDGGFDARFQIELKLPDGQTKTVIWPDDLQSRGQRRQRIESLAIMTGSMPAGSVIEGDLPQGVANWLVREWGATGGEIRLQGRQLPDAWFRPLPTEYQTVKSWRLIVASGQVSLLKNESAADTAPATPRRSTTPVGPTANPKN